MGGQRMIQEAIMLGEWSVVAAKWRGLADA
jgi:hypothetical protein